MNAGEIRIGIIGFGRMAKVYHLPSLRKVAGARVVAVADTRANLRDEARKLGIDHFFEDYHEMYKKVDLDLVMICSPPQIHRQPTILAAEKGIAVFCEKPMAPSLEDCDAMIHACEDAGVPLYLGFIRRFDPGFERLRKTVQ